MYTVHRHSGAILWVVNGEPVRNDRGHKPPGNPRPTATLKHLLKKKNCSLLKRLQKQFAKHENSK